MPYFSLVFFFLLREENCIHTNHYDNEEKKKKVQDLFTFHNNLLLSNWDSLCLLMLPQKDCRV